MLEDFLYKLQRSRFVVTIAILVVFSLIAVNGTKIIMRNYDLIQQVDRLEQEIAVLELKNANLRYQINYYGTDAFLDLESRDKLSLAAPGERLLILPKDRYAALEQDSSGETDQNPTGIKANLSAWTDFLFGNNDW